MKANNLTKLAFLLIMIISGCTREDDPGLDQTPVQAISVIADTQGDPETRSVLSGIETHWVAGTDQIGIFSPQAKPAADGSTPANNKAFTAQSSAKSSAFTGVMYWGSTSISHTFYAYYPYNSGYTGDQTAVPVTLPSSQTQSAAGNSDHIGALDIMVASPKTITSPGEAGASVEPVGLSFHHLFSMIEFRVTGSGTLSQISLYGEYPLAFTGTINIEQSTRELYSFTNSSSSNNVTVNLGSPIALSGTAKSVYMMILPGYQLADMTIALKIDGDWRIMSKARPAIGLFERGRKYVVTLNSNGSGWTGGDMFADPRDNHLYHYTTIGSQVWMTENLAYLPSVNTPVPSLIDPRYYVYSYGGGTDVSAAKATANYRTYGVLYNWLAAMNGAASSSSNPSGVQGVCPTGWHLPSYAEWEQLKTYLGPNYAGAKMKETGTAHWESPNTGATNESGFTALPGGSLHSESYFYGSGSNGMWWSTTENDTNTAWRVELEVNYNYLYNFYYSKASGFSVRCVKD